MGPTILTLRLCNGCYIRFYGWQSRYLFCCLSANDSKVQERNRLPLLYVLRPTWPVSRAVSNRTQRRCYRNGSTSEGLGPRFKPLLLSKPFAREPLSRPYG